MASRKRESRASSLAASARVSWARGGTGGGVGAAEDKAPKIPRIRASASAAWAASGFSAGGTAPGLREEGRGAVGLGAALQGHTGEEEGQRGNEEGSGDEQRAGAAV